ncbi:MAG: hypothetical protein J07HN6_01633 [Halonotius sp. J07HN6]|jgi:hypothetical protein|nr:MAG: hypothetical protein J07HN6_01633 [Halonotius sp. J07HN6]ERH05535.1 MAG: hypothetical protein J07HN4v3_01136 [Halonotius sp. J07HN4]
MHKLRTLSLPTYRGREFFFTVFVEPDPTPFESFSVPADADQWGMSIHFQPDDPYESHVEVARIDTSHGEPHFDHLYASTQRKEWLGHEYTFDDARQRLLSNWRAYADQFSERDAGEF